MYSQLINNISWKNQCLLYPKSLPDTPALEETKWPIMECLDIFRDIIESWHIISQVYMVHVGTPPKMARYNLISGEASWLPSPPTQASCVSHHGIKMTHDGTPIMCHFLLVHGQIFSFFLIFKNWFLIMTFFSKNYNNVPYTHGC